jgi:putative membrane protein
MTVHDLPPIEAALNATSTVLITAGFIFIKRGDMRRHRACMLTAAVTSALFLVFYVAYHALMRNLHAVFGGTGAVRTLYLVILWTHIPLAALIAFLVPRTFILALQGQYERHKKWARITFPIWYYVSVTGVIVYLFLYVWWPTGQVAS